MASQSDELHPGVLKAQQKLADGRMSRREFLRVATLLGASVPVAYALAACAPVATPTAAPTSVPVATAMPAAPTGPPATAVPAAGAIKRGGPLKVAIQVPKVDHPARFSW